MLCVDIIGYKKCTECIKEGRVQLLYFAFLLYKSLSLHSKDKCCLKRNSQIFVSLQSETTVCVVHGNMGEEYQMKHLEYCSVLQSLALGADNHM